MDSYKKFYLSLGLFIVFILAFILNLCFYNNVYITAILGLLSFGNLWLAGRFLCMSVHPNGNEERFIPKGQYDEDPKLVTFYGFGTRFYGVTKNPHIHYRFISMFFLPFYPIECYTARKYQGGYQWIGFAEPHKREIAGIILKCWGGVIASFFLVFCIALIINLINN